MGPPIPGPSEVAPLDLAILAVAPRSYWKSSLRKPTEAGLLSDYRHILSYAVTRFPTSNIVLYGHSLGGAVSVCLTSRVCATIKGLIVENPFASIPGMVKALYPQRWLPYHYLGIFTFDRWDAYTAMTNATPDSLIRKLSSSLMLIPSKNDELMPNVMGESFFEAPGKLLGGSNNVIENSLRRTVVLRKSLHESAWKEWLWLTEMRRYIQSVGTQ